LSAVKKMLLFWLKHYICPDTNNFITHKTTLVNTRKFLLLASLSGMFAVVLGAFGAHILKKMLHVDQVQIFETGIRYHFYHTFALIAVAILARYLPQRWIVAAGWLFVVGILFFSGSLYLLALVEPLGLHNATPVLGPMTPIGGLLLMGGWLAMFRAAFDYKKTGSKRSSSSE
jgi:uncharacterized membrane protein YgdD (TMEM256/DUF423 family)